MKIRAFLALPLPGPLRNELQRMAQGLARADRLQEVRWVPPENYHVTLQFLGDVLHADLAVLRAELDRVVAGMPAPVLTVRELTYFPFRKRPQLVLAMLESGRELLALQKEILALTRRQGFAQQRHRYLPHVTLGRVRSRGVPRLEIAPVPLASQGVADRVVLYRSELDHDGARYYEQYSIALMPGQCAGWSEGS